MRAARTSADTLLMIILCATSARCVDATLTRNVRTIDSSLFAWPQAIFRDRPDLSAVFSQSWPGRSLREWTRKGVASLVASYLTSFANPGNKVMRIEFGPEDGLRDAITYQRRFGYRGERLIEQLGNGLAAAQSRGPPAPSDFLTPPLPPSLR